MKKLFTIVCLLSVALISQAQISAVHDTADFACMPMGQASDIHNPVKNNSGSDQKITWLVTAINLPSNGWTITQICDNLSCIAPISLGTGTVSDVVTNGNDMDLKVTYDISSSADIGQGIVVIKAATATDTIDVVFSGLVCPLSVKSEVLKDFKAYYYDNQIKLINESSSDAKSYVIYSAFGQIVAEGKIDEQIEVIPFQLPASVYVIQVLDKENNSLGAQKFSNL